jgi:hypothetical protein
VGLTRVDEQFKDTNITCYVGPPEDAAAGYRWGGCPYAEEAYRYCGFSTWRLTGRYPDSHGFDTTGDIRQEREKVIFVGDWRPGKAR